MEDADQVRLQDIFIPERVKLGMAAAEREQAFEELVDLLVESYNLDCRGEILEAIRIRESKISTGIKKGIAIPHGKANSVKGVLGVIGVSRKGVNYDALDGEPVHLFFLLVSSPEDAARHLEALKRIAHLLESQSFYDEMLSAANPERANHILKNYDEINQSRQAS